MVKTVVKGGGAEVKIEEEVEIEVPANPQVLDTLKHLKAVVTSIINMAQKLGVVPTDTNVQ